MITRTRDLAGRLFARGGFRGPVLTLLSGSVVTMAVGYLAQPILTRLYLPAEFGAYDYFVTIVTVLAPVASLRYEDAVMLPPERHEALRIVQLALLCTVTFSLLLTLAAVLPFVRPLLADAGAGALLPWVWLLGPTLLLARGTKLAEVWLARSHRFRLITAGDGINKLSMTAGKVGAGVAGAGPLGLVGGFVGAQLLAALFYGRALLGRSMPTRLRLDRVSLAEAARRYRRFPLYSMPAALLNNLVGRLPVLFLPLHFDMAAVGYYGRAFIALAVPLGIVGQSIAQVFFVHAAEAERAGDLAGLTTRIHARLVMIGLFPTLLLVTAGPDLLAFVFGDVWRDAGRFARVLAPWFFLAAVASPLTRVFDVLERQRADLLVSIGMFTALVAVLGVVGGRQDLWTTLALLGAAGAMLRLVHLTVILRLAGVRLLDALAPYLRYTLMALPGLLLLALALGLRTPWLTAGAAFAGGILYGVLVLWRDRIRLGFGS